MEFSDWMDQSYAMRVAAISRRRTAEAKYYEEKVKTNPELMKKRRENASKYYAEKVKTNPALMKKRCDLAKSRYVKRPKKS